MALLTQADFDGELDAGRAAELARHRAGCAACNAAYQRLASVRTALREESLYQRAPAELRSLPAAAPAKSAVKTVTRWRSASSFGLGAALAAGIALLLSWQSAPGLVDQVVDDHIRALQPGHLQDVESTDRHTVKPWFDGRIDFAPPVKDLADKQFPLKGGRLDYLDGRPVAAMVYERGHHPIDLFVWPVGNLPDVGPAVSERRGYNTIHWTQNEMTLWAVSDLEQSQLEDFVRLWREAQ